MISPFLRVIFEGQLDIASTDNPGGVYSMPFVIGWCIPEPSTLVLCSLLTFTALGAHHGYAVAVLNGTV